MVTQTDDPGDQIRKMKASTRAVVTGVEETHGTQRPMQCNQQYLVKKSMREIRATVISSINLKRFWLGLPHK